MVIVVPLRTTDQLIDLAQVYNLSLPIPLSSGCESYLSSEEMAVIFDLLTPLQHNDKTVAALMTDLQAYIDQHKPVVPCDH